MISGAHMVLFSKDAEADRAFFRDELDWPHVDAGSGWLIFKLPPAEIAVHPSETGGAQEIYLMTPDIEALKRDLAARGHVCSAIRDEGWGLVMSLTLPGGSGLGIYEPRHAVAAG